jgi:16S rRNA (adenine1518-N6/adenine1519-N6)-dimethyltransferase
VSGIEDLPPLREIVRKYDLAAKKSLGQNFLFDLNLTRRIARAAGPLAGVTIVEIGPGPGGLTRALLAEGATRVIAVERDERCLPALAELSAAADGRLEIVAGDARTTDLEALVRARTASAPARICANLPYNVATVLLAHWLEGSWPPWFDRLTLMFQREVAERIVAKPKERKDYGRLAVLCGWRTRARILFDLPPAAFTPPPKVTSSIVELVPIENPLPCQVELLGAITQSAFGQRRKMLRQSLKSLTAAGRAIDVVALLAEAEIEPTRRAEEIDIEGFVRLARVLEEMAGEKGAKSQQ